MNRSVFWWLFALFVIIGGALPLGIDSAFWIDFLTLTLFLAVLGQGWNILGGYGGQFSFGHAIFFGVGAYTQIILQTKLGFDAWSAIPFAVFAGVLTGLGTGYLSFRYGLRGSYFALITLAFAEAFRVLATAMVGITEGGQGIYLALNQDPSRSFATLQFGAGYGYYYIALALTAVSLLIAFWLEHTRFGAQLMAIREDEDAAEAIGVNAFKVKMQAICLSGAVTALGGVFYAQKFLYLSPNTAFGPTKSVEMLVMPIIGGMGTIFGPLVGSAFLHTVGELSKSAAHTLVGDRPGLDLVVYGAVLVLVLAVLPNGLVGIIKTITKKLSSRKVHHA